MKAIKREELVEIKDQLVAIGEKLNRMYWDGHAEIGQTAYSHTNDQLKDGQVLGRLADAQATLRSARSQLSDACSLLS
jgi:hypothetical protein